MAWMQTPAVIPITSPWSSFYTAISESATAPASATSIANEAVYVPFIVTTPATFTRGFWLTGTLPDGVTTAQVGIYDTAQVRLASTAATAMSGASVIQSAAFTASVALLPGVYYMAFVNNAADANGITGYSASVSRGRTAGYYRQASAAPLPATATFATWASTLIPYFGVATTSFAL